MKWADILHTEASGWTVLVRLSVGLVVFLPEGIQKLIFIPLPDVTGPFVGVVETVCGLLIIIGLFTRLAAIPLIIIMIVALISTKLPILLGHDIWIFHLARDIKRTGFWSMMHEARADLTMLLGCIYLAIVGAGSWSVDGLIGDRRKDV
jgi:uncharacterized membrane protein YphA (DoxX/SURF4 family)